MPKIRNIWIPNIIKILKQFSLNGAKTKSVCDALTAAKSEIVREHHLLKKNPPIAYA